MDIATVTGCAVGVAGGAPHTWEMDLGKGSNAERFSRAIKGTFQACRKHEPDLVAIEAAVGGPKTSHYLVGLAACVSGAVIAAGYKPPISCNIGSVRKHFLGHHLSSRSFPNMSKSRARAEIKRTVIARCRTLGWCVETDNEADAAAIWDYACATHDAGHHITTVGGLFA